MLEDAKQAEDAAVSLTVADILALTCQLPYSEKNKLPEESGVYFVADRDSIHYIGQAQNIKNRIKGHHLARYFRQIEDAKIIWMYFQKEVLNTYEYAFIRRVHPHLNDVSYDGFYSSTLKIEKLPKDIYKKVMAKGGSAWIRELVIKTIQAEEEQLIIPTMEGILHDAGDTR
ncbi:GIY-YIG nuclease family protein [Scytonema sp. PCC 10023]|uniref:GIY-YIG nuclease family protein n=1 Tax=Scytonema sp. PCC 10023 TaxID=1680591 RepID=UPI0039C75A6D